VILLEKNGGGPLSTMMVLTAELVPGSRMLYAPSARADLGCSPCRSFGRYRKAKAEALSHRSRLTVGRR
jgi:hypothetical protein